MQVQRLTQQEKMGRLTVSLDSIKQMVLYIMRLQQYLSPIGASSGLPSTLHATANATVPRINTNSGGAYVYMHSVTLHHAWGLLIRGERSHFRGRHQPACIKHTFVHMHAHMLWVHAGTNLLSAHNLAPICSARDLWGR